MQSGPFYQQRGETFPLLGSGAGQPMAIFDTPFPDLYPFSGGGRPYLEWQDDILLKPDDSFATEVAKKFKDLEDPDRGWAAYAPKYDDMIIEASKDKMKRSFGWMTRIQPVTLESGRILLPLYSDGLNMSMVAISDDNGATWRPSLPIVGRGPIQPALAIRKSGEVVAYMRDSGDAPARVNFSTSKDQGESWSAAKKTDIPNEASVEIYVLKNGNGSILGMISTMAVTSFRSTSQTMRATAGTKKR